jgi:DNA repair protein RecO (recombination protein O)
LLWLDNHDEMANFHLILMLETTKYLGFYPDTSDMDMPFEMTEGFYSYAISSLSEHETNLFKN